MSKTCDIFSSKKKRSFTFHWVTLHISEFYREEPKHSGRFGDQSVHFRIFVTKLFPHFRWKDGSFGKMKLIGLLVLMFTKCNSGCLLKSAKASFSSIQVGIELHADESSKKCTMTICENQPWGRSNCHSRTANQTSITLKGEQSKSGPSWVKTKFVYFWNRPKGCFTSVDLGLSLRSKLYAKTADLP